MKSRNAIIGIGVAAALVAAEAVAGFEGFSLDKVVYRPGEQVVVTLSADAAAPDGQGKAIDRLAELTATYTCAQLIRGNMDYSQWGKGGKYKRIQVNFETAPQGSGRLAFTLTEVDGGPAAQASFPAPSRYGMMVLSVSLQAGETAPAVQDLNFVVAPPVPLERSGSIMGRDGHGTVRRQPNAWDLNAVEGVGLNWLHMYGWRAFGRVPDEDLPRCADVWEQWIDAARRLNAKICFCLLNGHPELDLERFGKYVDLLFTRFGDKVDAWDVWNEPDSKGYAQVEDKDIEVLRIVHEAKVRHGLSGAVITSSHANHGIDYMARILEKGAGRWLDGMGIHPYRGLAPEIPEADGYTGNPTHEWTLLQGLANVRDLLVKHDVEPAIYITEYNYSLNLVPQYDENDQANFMIRSAILCSTVETVKSFMIHAMFNGRLLRAGLPNLERHLMDTRYRERLDSGDPETHAYVFEKSDGRLAVPAWRIRGRRIATLGGARGPVSATDMYGNAIEISETGPSANLVELTEAPVYLVFPSGSTPAVSFQALLELAVDGRLMPGGASKVTVTVKSFPPDQKDASVVLQAAPGWQVTPESMDAGTAGEYAFRVAPPADAAPDTYPLLASLVAADGRAFAFEDTEIVLESSQAQRRKKYGLVLASDFEHEKLAGWKLGTSVQGLIDIVEEDGAHVVRISQHGVDHPATLARTFEGVPAGIFAFEFKPLSEAQSFNIRLGGLILEYRDGAVGLVSSGEFQRIADIRAGDWNSVALFFSAPDGRLYPSVNGKAGTEITVPAADAVTTVRFATGLRETRDRTTFLFKDIKVVRIVPDELDAEGAIERLNWAYCGPYPNRIDPATKKRPFETDVDYLAPVGREATARPYPTLAVPGADGEALTFSPFRRDPEKVVNFFDVEHLGLYPSQADILVYGAAYLNSPDEREVVVKISSDDSNSLWINHALIGKMSAWPIGRSVGQEVGTYTVGLRKGLNVFLIKIDQGHGGFQFFCTVEAKAP